MASGIKDKVAILGMGCSKFGERWDMGAEELIVEAYLEAMQDAGVETSQIQAAWFSTAIDEQHVGKGGTPLSVALRLPNVAVTHVENFCASGSEAFRGAVYAVAAGACDIALALGVEKLKDTGYGGLPQREQGTLNPLWSANGSAPGNFAQLASAYRAKHGVSKDDLKRAIAHVSVKSHANGTKNAKAHLQKAITEEMCLNAPMIAEPLGSVRLLRRVGWGRLRHRHHAGNRPRDGQDGHHHGQGAAARAVERPREPAQFLGRQLFPHRAHRGQARL